MLFLFSPHWIRLWSLCQRERGLGRWLWVILGPISQRLSLELLFLIWCLYRSKPVRAQVPAMLLFIWKRLLSPFDSISRKTRNSHAPTCHRRRAFSLSNIISLLPYSRGTSGNLIFLLSMQHPTCPLLWWHLYRIMRIIQKRIGPVELELSSSLDAQLSSIPAKVWETNPIKRWTPCR